MSKSRSFFCLLATGTILLAMIATAQVPASALPAPVAVRLSLAETCPGSVPSQLQVGMAGQVSITPAGQTPLPVRVHQTPTVGSPVLFTLKDGAPFTVVAGPICADGFTWWQIQAAPGTGWAAEGDTHGYFIVPATAAAVPTGAATAAAPEATADSTAVTITDLVPPPQTICAGILPSRIATGLNAAAGSGDDSVSAIVPVTLYSAPDPTSSVVATAHPGDAISVDQSVNLTADQQCANGRVWWYGKVVSEKDYSYGPSGYFAEADARQYYVDPPVIAAKRFTPVGSTPFAISFGGVQLTYGPLWQVTGPTPVLAQWYGRGFTFGLGAVGATYITFGPDCDSCDPFTGSDVSVYQIQDSLLESYLQTSAQAIKQLLRAGSVPGYQLRDQARMIDSFGAFHTDAAPLFNAKFKKLHFKGGSLIRFLTIFTQADVPVGSDTTLEYDAVGITDDNQRLVVFQHWLKLPDLRGNDAIFPAYTTSDAQLESDIAAYYIATAKLIGNAPDSHFSVNLGDLDAYAESIQVGPLPSAP